MFALDCRGRFLEKRTVHLEPWTREMADLSFARAMAVADTARRNRCVPILVTPAPVFGTNPEAEAHRQHNRTRGRAAAQAGGYLLDLDTLWGTGATPNTYRREYDWGDQMHPNDAACAAAARVLAPMLQQILGRL